MDSLLRLLVCGISFGPGVRPTDFGPSVDPGTAAQTQQGADPALGAPKPPNLSKKDPIPVETTTLKVGEKTCETVIVLDPLRLNDARERMVRLNNNYPGALWIVPPEVGGPAITMEPLSGHEFDKAGAVMVDSQIMDNFEADTMAAYVMSGLNRAGTPADALSVINQSHPDPKVLLTCGKVGRKFSDARLEPDEVHPEGIHVYHIKAEVKNGADGKGSVTILPAQRVEP